MRKRATGIPKTLIKCSADFDPPSGLPVFNALPAHKPDGTGRPEFAINLRIPTFEALLAEIGVMLLAFIGSVDFGMTGTLAHGRPLSNRIFKYLNELDHDKRLGCRITGKNAVDGFF